MKYGSIEEHALCPTAAQSGGSYLAWSDASQSFAPEAQAVSGGTSRAKAPVGVELLNRIQGSTEVELSVEEAIRRKCEHFDPLYRALEEISECRLVWSRESEPPSEQAIDDARALLARLQAVDFPPERIIPSAEGGIGMFFRSGDKYADFECANAGSITAVVSDGRGTVRAFLVDASFESENRAIAELRGFLKS